MHTMAGTRLKNVRLMFALHIGKRRIKLTLEETVSLHNKLKILFDASMDTHEVEEDKTVKVEKIDGADR